MISLNKQDFTLLGQVALHCDQRKLDISINESINFDFKPLLCDFFYDVNENWDSTETIWRELIDGSTYVNCRGNTVSFSGLKDSLIYYAYSRYILINAFDDTPNGQVTKTNNFTIPKPLKEMESYATKYRNMGLITFKNSLGFICSNSEVSAFINFDFSTCEKCDCSSCKPQTKARGFGLRGSNISRDVTINPSDYRFEDINSKNRN